MLFRRVAAFWGSDESRGPITATEKLWMVCWLSAGAVAWGVVRSSWNSSGVNGAANQVPEAISIGFFLLLALPVIVAFRSLDRLSWLLGATVTVGLLPQVPLMPFAREGVHVVLLALALTVAIRRLSVPERWPDSLPLRLYWSFLGVCSFSILFAQLFGNAGIWELKVGVAEMILYTAFGVVVAGLCRAGNERGGAPSPVIDGLAWASLAQVAIMLAAIGLSIATPLVRGNDSLWGLGFWDRIKSTFAGPDNAGVFFTCSIPLMVYWGQRQVRRFPQFAALAYMQLVPWLIMATGSRGARIAMLVVLAACLANRQLRPWIIRALPSFFAASYVGFMFQSFPSAVQVLLMDILDWWQRTTGIVLFQFDPLIRGMSLEGRFFHDESRLSLMKQSWEYFQAAPLINKLIGFGFGVGGFRMAEYPSPHNILDLVIETGLIGFSLVIGFFIACFVSLFRRTQRVSMNESGSAVAATFPMVISLVVVALCAAIYELQTWGIVMMVLGVAVVLTHECEQGPHILTSRSPFRSAG